MTVEEIAHKLNLTVVSGTGGINNEITGGYVSDLLSDVMGHSRQGQVWITLQTHKNVMAIASLKDLAAIIIVKGFQPDDDTVQQSDIEHIPILSTQNQAFETAGLLFNLIR